MSLRKTKTKAPARTREEMSAAVLGPHHAALRAVSKEPLLLARMEAYAAVKGAEVIDLSEIPAYRHLAHIEEILSRSEVLTAGGPCQVCGTATRRRGRRDTALADLAEPPGFNVAKNLIACGWCAHELQTYGERSLRIRVFLAAAGCWQMGGLSTPPGALFAHEVPSLGDGTPWSHIDRAEARRTAHERLHWTCFATTQGRAEHASIPGLPPYIWVKEDLPHPPQKVMTWVEPEPSPAQKRERAAYERRQKEATEQERRRKAAHLASLPR